MEQNILETRVHGALPERRRYGDGREDAYGRLRRVVMAVLAADVRKGQVAAGVTYETPLVDGQGVHKDGAC